MGNPVQELPQGETISVLWPPTPQRRSWADQDSRGSDCDPTHDELAPVPWQRPCSSIYSIGSSSVEEAAAGAEDATKPSQSSAVAYRTDESRPVLWLPTTRPRSSIYSVDTSFSIPILWQPTARPRSSIYSVDSLSWDELTARVDESMRASQLETIARLTQEKSLLQDKLLLYRQTWHEFANLFGRLLHLTLHIRGIIEDYNGAITAAEGAWVASWGIVWV